MKIGEQRITRGRVRRNTRSQAISRITRGRIHYPQGGSGQPARRILRKYQLLEQELELISPISRPECFKALAVIGALSIPIEDSRSLEAALISPVNISKAVTAGLKTEIHKELTIKGEAELSTEMLMLLLEDT